ncbi:hypothetical protein LCGC14_2327630 [marine sediment metagenome]|uniref:DUF8033 domain-containing protein n=1 Tax=marine sediment metagenome TaxID=412755 RepID=A0A0F9D3C5_9ZZZZ
MKAVSVDNLNGVVNQFIITTPKGQYFQSYDSIIVFVPANSGKIQLDEYYWAYSKTTGRYRNIFLGETKAETQRNIDNGTYKLTNLN